MSHYISLSTAVTMTSLYRSQRESILQTVFQGNNVLPICETFDRDAIDSLLAQNGCASLRVYYGMNEDYQVHAILVGVDSDGGDILPSTSLDHGEDDLVVDNGNRCPPICPPASDLNS